MDKKWWTLVAVCAGIFMLLRGTADSAAARTAASRDGTAAGDEATEHIRG